MVVVETGDTSHDSKSLNDKTGQYLQSVHRAATQMASRASLF